VAEPAKARRIIADFVRTTLGPRARAFSQQYAQTPHVLGNAPLGPRARAFSQLGILED